MAPIDSPRHSDVWLKGKHSPHPLASRKSVMDPCKILEPKRKTLQSLEAERIMTVFHDTVKRMEITTALPCILESLPRFSVMFGQELSAHLRSHLRLQNAYKEVFAELHRISEQEKAQESGAGRAKMNPTDNEGFVELHIMKMSSPGMLLSKNVLKQEEDFLRKGIKCSLKEMLRFFRKNPKAIETITGEQVTMRRKKKQEKKNRSAMRACVGRKLYL